jgi:membrane-associated phospholipid phosphatase
VSRAKLRVTALICLVATAILGLAVSHTRARYGFERPAVHWLRHSSSLNAWFDFTDYFATPAIGVAFVASCAVGYARRALPRVIVYATFAAAALLVSEYVAKPLVRETYFGNLSFPSGNVTAVCATALAMWMALYPLLGKRTREVTFVLGVAWTVLMCLAVVALRWHTPIDTVGSIFLSIGIVTAGAAVYEPAPTRTPPADVGRVRVGDRG